MYLLLGPTKCVPQLFVQLSPQGALRFNYYRVPMLLGRDGLIELRTKGTSELDHDESRSATGSRRVATRMASRMVDRSGPTPDPIEVPPL